MSIGKSPLPSTPTNFSYTLIVFILTGFLVLVRSRRPGAGPDAGAPDRVRLGGTGSLAPRLELVEDGEPGAAGAPGPAAARRRAARRVDPGLGNGLVHRPLQLCALSMVQQVHSQRLLSRDTRRLCRHTVAS